MFVNHGALSRRLFSAIDDESLPARSRISRGSRGEGCSPCPARKDAERTPGASATQLPCYVCAAGTSLALADNARALLG
eukprot:303683-Pleurochrysis_carterae.AAC.1